MPATGEPAVRTNPTSNSARKVGPREIHRVDAALAVAAAPPDRPLPAPPPGVPRHGIRDNGLPPRPLRPHRTRRRDSPLAGGARQPPCRKSNHPGFGRRTPPHNLDSRHRPSAPGACVPAAPPAKCRRCSCLRYRATTRISMRDHGARRPGRRAERPANCRLTGSFHGPPCRTSGSSAPAAGTPSTRASVPGPWFAPLPHIRPAGAGMPGGHPDGHVNHRSPHQRPHPAGGSLFRAR